MTHIGLGQSVPPATAKVPASEKQSRISNKVNFDFDLVTWTRVGPSFQPISSSGPDISNLCKQGRPTYPKPYNLSQPAIGLEVALKRGRLSHDHRGVLFDGHSQITYGRDNEAHETTFRLTLTVTAVVCSV